jgi:cyanophycinase
VTRLLAALLGSGEFEPWAEAVDAWLLERAQPSPGKVLVLPTASAPEGEHVFNRWAEMGLQHYARLGVPAEVVPLHTRADAERPEVVRMLEDASLAFFSGGNPAYLAGTLAGTPFWDALREKLAQGLAYGGCSAGVACLGERAPDSAIRQLGPDRWQPGLGLFPRILFGPHWDRVNTYRPGLREFIISSLPPGCTLVGVDERTALVGDGHAWTVMGSSGVHLLRSGTWRDYQAGESISAEQLNGWSGS